MGNLFSNKTSTTSNTEDSSIIKSQSEDKFDLAQFNKKFDDAKKKMQLVRDESDQEQLSKLNNVAITKPLTSYSIGELMIGIKDTWFDTIDDILHFNITSDLMSKNNRLFFFGLTFLIIFVFLYLFDLIIGKSHSSDNNSINNSDNDSGNTNIKQLFNMKPNLNINHMHYIMNQNAKTTAKIKLPENISLPESVIDSNIDTDNVTITAKS